MKTVGYFDGTDSALLTELVANGFGTLPLANDWDGHGKSASHLEPGVVDLIVGYLHKIVPPTRESERKEEHPTTNNIGAFRGLSPLDLLYPAKTYGIPVLVIVPAKYHEAAKQLLGEAAEFVTIVKPEDLEDKVREFLGF
jgi:hypothetical protein